MGQERQSGDAREKERETFVKVLIMRVSSSGQGKWC
jgi:hypothetical protein